MTLLQAIQEHVEKVASWNPAAAAPSAEFSYIDLSSVDQEQKVITEARIVVGADAPSRARQLVKAGDVLVSTVRPNLNGVARVPPALDRATASTGFTVLRANERTLSGAYLLHWVKTPQFVDGMVRKATGASYPAVSDRIVCDSKIPLPPMEEQRRIAAILDRAEALRAKRRQALAKLDTLTQSLFLEMFGDPASNPFGWSNDSLGTICDVRDGTHDSPKYIDGGFPLVTSKNLTSGNIDLSNTQRISEANFNSINRRSKVDTGDILMPMIGTIGSPVIVEQEPNFAIKNVALIKFIPSSPTNSFVHAFLASSYFDSIVRRDNRGGTQKFLSLGDIRSIQLPQPPRELQENFARRVIHTKQILNIALASSRKLEEAFASLQHRAFRGEL